MKRLLLLILAAMLGVALAFPKQRAELVLGLKKVARFLPPLPALPKFASLPDLKSNTGKFQKSEKADGCPGAENFPLTRDLCQNSRPWTFTDGSELNAVLVADDAKTAQFHVPQGVWAGEDRSPRTAGSGKNPVARSIRGHRWSGGPAHPAEDPSLAAGLARIC
jgi:hypothetical protein